MKLKIMEVQEESMRNSKKLEQKKNKKRNRMQVIFDNPSLTIFYNLVNKIENNLNSSY